MYYNMLTQGAINLFEQCLVASPDDKIILISEKENTDIAIAIEKEAAKRGFTLLTLNIEDFISRPADRFPEQMANKVREFKPTISIYAASARQGELPRFRRPLVKMLTNELKCRHAHMVGIDTKVFEIGMNQNYKVISEFTYKVTDLVKNSTKLHATCPFGTDAEFIIDNDKYNWIPSDGIINTPGEVKNLPDGETYTYPELANGKVVAWILGDIFQIGELKEPLIVDIKDSFITSIECKDNKLAEDFRKYVSEYEFGNRVGELGVGTLLNLESFSGNLLLDEKFPGIHVAFGGTYSHETNAEWDAQSHVDIIPKKVDIEIYFKDKWEKIMSEGKFLMDKIEELHQRL